MHGAGAAGAEAPVFPGEKAERVPSIACQLGADKLLRGHAAEARGEGHQEAAVETCVRQVLKAELGGGQQRRALLGPQYGQGVRIEGQSPGLGAGFPGMAQRRVKNAAVAAVYAVEKACRERDLSPFEREG